MERGELRVPCARIPVDRVGDLARQEHVDANRAEVHAQTRLEDGQGGVERVEVGLAHREGAAAGLEDEGEEVGEHEDDGDGARAQPGDVLAVDGDDASQAEVDGGADEGGTDRDADDLPAMVKVLSEVRRRGSLDVEADLHDGVVFTLMEEDARCVGDDLENQAG